MQNDLLIFRDQLDEIDERVIKLLAERFKITQQIGVFKSEHNLPPADPAREARQLKRIAELANAYGLDPFFAQSLLRLIIDEVVKNHKQIQSKHN